MQHISSHICQLDWWLYLGSISSTYLQEALPRVAPKSIRIQSSCQYLFTLLGSTCTKAARKMLMKLTPALVQIHFLTKTEFWKVGKLYYLKYLKKIDL